MTRADFVILWDVTEKGRAVGIREEERQAKYGRNYISSVVLAS